MADQQQAYLGGFGSSADLLMTRNAFWLLFEKIGGFAFAFALQVVLARYLVKEDYGQVVYVRAVIASLGFLGLTSLNTSITTAAANHAWGNFWKGTKLVLAFGFLGSGVLAALSWIHFNVFGKPELALLIFVCSLGAPILWYVSYEAFWLGRGLYARKAIGSLGFLLTQLLLVGGLIYVDPTPLSTVIGFVAAAVIFRVVCLLTTIYEVSNAAEAASFDEKAHQFGMNTSLKGNIAVGVSQEIHKLTVGVSDTKGLAELAVSDLFRTQLIGTSAGFLQSLLLPKLAKCTEEEGHAIIRGLFFPVALAYSAICLCVYFVLSPLIPLIYGVKYGDCAAMATALAVAGTIQSPASLILCRLKSQSSTRETLTVFWITALSKYAVVLPLGLIFNSWGAVTGILISAALVTLAALYIEFAR
ncbi:MAG: hypothetical protein Aurels2KO_27180 [Aureliella sp.]